MFVGRERVVSSEEVGCRTGGEVGEGEPKIVLSGRLEARFSVKEGLLVAEEDEKDSGA